MSYVPKSKNSREKKDEFSLEQSNSTGNKKAAAHSLLLPTTGTLYEITYHTA